MNYFAGILTWSLNPAFNVTKTVKVLNILAPKYETEIRRFLEILSFELNAMQCHMQAEDLGESTAGPCWISAGLTEH